MVPLLLLLMLTESLTGQEVCVSLSSGDIELRLGTNDLVISDNKGHLGMNCTWSADHCFAECTKTNGSHLSNCTEIRLLHAPSLTLKFIIPLSSTICSVTMCKMPAILLLIKELNTPITTEKGLLKLLSIRRACRDIFSSNYTMQRVFIEVERRVIHNIISLQSLRPGDSKYYDLKDLALYVVNFHEANLSSPAPDGRMLVDTPKLLPQNDSFLPETWLPVDALRKLNQEERTVGMVSYMWHDQFLFEQEEVSSMVIRIELLGEKCFTNLATSAMMKFNSTGHTNMSRNSSLVCHFFDEHDFTWKTEGCDTDVSYYDNHIHVECSCDHTTPFAVLLMRGAISPVHWEILSYISYIGCGLSAFFTALSVITYVINRTHQENSSMSIHVSLSGALFLLNSSFLLSEWGATVKLDWVCVFIAAVMHYSLLCSFTWMAIEALHLYLMLIKVFNTHYKHYLVKLSVAGWGIPCVIVGVSLGVTDIRPFYGSTEMEMDATNQTNAICWIIDDLFFYGVNLVYFTIIFLLNTGVLSVVAFRICKMRAGSAGKPMAWQGKNGGPGKLPLAFTDVLTVLGLTCILGTTWGLAFLATGHINYPILYLFCIFNSLQGLFIFLWICGTARKERKRAQESKITSANYTSSADKTKDSICDRNPYH